MLLIIPKTSTPYQIREGDVGLRVWAVQRGLNSVGYSLEEDADFGPNTQFSVAKWQSERGLGSDGIFGPGSSAELAHQFDSLISSGLIPPGLTRGQVEVESGNWIAAVNWKIAAGVDCGYAQKRVYTIDQNDQQVVKRAFDSEHQINLLASRLSFKHQLYLGGLNDAERAWRLASLSWNWPYGADTLSKTKVADLSSWWTLTKPPDQWPTSVGARFPGGAPVDTPLKWARYYALGAPERNWPGATAKYVSTWI